MRETLTAVLSLRMWRPYAASSALEGALPGPAGGSAETRAPGFAAAQGQTIRSFIAMAQAARRARES